MCERLKGLRERDGYTIEQMAGYLEITTDEYKELEKKHARLIINFNE